ncbi:MAG: sn-glycerol-1-phosphate dehydrogenase [Actinomycetaceae bacterium]
MTEDLITTALKTASDTKAIVHGRGVVGETGRLFAEQFGGRRGIVVADGNTWALAGEAVTESLRAAGVELEEPYVLPGTPTLYAGYENVELVREHLRGSDAVACSIGSGTLNDIVKLASGELERPYMNVCTAASMDGYAAFGASITKDGFKITRNCPAPTALVADLDLMATAPQRLTATGFGDLIEKVPAGADWLISDVLGVEKVDDYVWGLVQGPLRESLSRPDELAKSDPDALSGLAEGLLMSGLAMQAHESSRPASGAGHQFSHTWEMEGHGLDWEPPLSHGFKVGLGTVAICALYEVALTKDVPGINIDALVAAWPTREEMEARVRAMHTAERAAPLVEPAVQQTLAKYLEPEELRERLELVVREWPTIVAKCREQLIPAAEAREMLRSVGAVFHPEQIDLDMERFRLTYYRAQTIRSRYTILDLLLELGLLEECVEELFSPEGYWSQDSAR